MEFSVFGSESGVSAQYKATPLVTPATAYLALSLLLVGVMTAPIQAQLVTSKPAGLDGVGIEEPLNELLPLETRFRDDRGREVTLADYFSTGRPVILTLNYAECPLLCKLQLEGLVTTLRDLDWNPGEKFDVLTVSIDPSETWQQAALAKQRHLQSYARPGTAAGWHFLTGSSDSIARLTDRVGFRYRFVAERGEYAHTAALIVCTPDGRISRYRYGIEYPGQTVRLSLVESAEGKIGSTLDQVLLFCFHYDAAAGRYGPSARRFMQIGGFITVLIVLLTLGPYWFRTRQRERSASSGDGPRQFVPLHPPRNSYTRG